MTINSISKRELQDLTASQLTRLLQMLLHLEINRYDLSGFYYVSQNITASDGGEDGRITVSDTKNSNYIVNKLTIFQCKASNLIPSKIESEFTQLGDDGNLILKPVIKDVLDDNGQYVLFMSADASTRQGIKNRVDKMVEVCNSLGYNYNESQFSVYDGQKISEWANDYISTITYLLECNGKSRPEVFRTYKQWGEDIQLKLTYPFQRDAVEEKMKLLKDYLNNSNVVRVIGHSGIGKTRMVYEALKDDPTKIDTEQNKLNASVVYYDNALIPNGDLIKYIYSFKELKVATIVVDNCTNDLHQALVAILKSNSKIKIVTLDYSLDTDEKNLVKISKSDQEATVKLMLKTLYSSFPESDIDNLARLAEGYPRMVELLNDAVERNGIDSITTELPKDFVNRLVFGRDLLNETELDVIKSCSIFSEFNFIDEEYEELFTSQEKLDELRKQRTFIANNVCNPPINDLSFYKICRKFKNQRSIMERRSFQYSVIPTPLAAHLAAEWLLDYPPDRFAEFSLQLVKEGLIDSFCERLRSLDQIERAKTIVAKLWGPQGPFVTAGVLNTELGSRLFRSVVEVNPIETANTLSTLFDDMPIDEISTWNTGRRNLIWSLEKLIFRGEVFYQAGIVLARFAAYETETIGNNSTNQFLQLFHIFLPGTEANFNQRLELLDYCIEQPEESFARLSISSIDSGLKSHSFHRMGGFDRQGFSTSLKDYQADTWNEIFEYWKACIDRLEVLYNKYPQFTVEIKAVIAKHLRGLMSHNQTGLLKQAIRIVKDRDRGLWIEAISAIKSTLQYEKLSVENISVLEAILDELSPKDWSNKIRYVVSIPEWDYKTPDFRKSTEIAETKVKELIEELITEEVDLISMLPQLLMGEQRRGVIFGKMLPNYFDEKVMANALIENIKKVETQSQSPEVLAGFMMTITAETRDLVINKIIADSELHKHLPFILRFGKITFLEVSQLINFIEKGTVDVDSLRYISFSRGDFGLSYDEITLILERLESLGEYPSIVALSLLDHMTRFDNSLWDLFKIHIKKLLLKYNYFLFMNNHRRMDIYEFCELIKRVLSESKDDVFVKSIATNFYEASKSERFFYSDHELAELADLLLKDYFDVVWPVWSKGFLADGIEYFNLKSILGAKNGNLGNSGLLFDGDKIDRIIEWCGQNKPKGPKRIAYIMPTFNTDKRGSLWHPFATKMLDSFYDVAGFTDEISANLGSFSWIGSSIPYYEKLRDMMVELLTHKSSAIKKWARSGKNYYEKQIKLEKLNDEKFSNGR